MLFYWLMFGAFALGALTYTVWVIDPARVGPNETCGQPPSPSALLTIVAVWLIFIVGLRDHVGGDWHNYEVAYDAMERIALFDALTRLRQEPAYTLVNWTASHFDIGIWLVNLVCAVPFSWGLIKLCKQQPNPWLCLLVAWPFLIIVVGMGFTRQGVALGFLMAAIADYIEKRSIGRFVALTLAGGLFHRTVLIFIPVLLLACARSKLVSAGFVALSCVLAYATIFSGSMGNYSSGYLNGRYEAAGAQVRVIMNILPAVVLLLNRKRFFRSREEQIVWTTFAVLSLLSGVALALISSSVVIDRLAMYLIPIQMFVFGRVSLVFSRDPHSDSMWRAVIVAYSAAVLFVWLNYGHYSAGWIPYRNYLLPR